MGKPPEVAAEHFFRTHAFGGRGKNTHLFELFSRRKNVCRRENQAEQDQKSASLFHGKGYPHFLRHQTSQEPSIADWALSSPSRAETISDSVSDRSSFS